MSGRPKRALSQNFLVDPNMRRKLVEQLAPAADEAILEVGPGHGELTELILQRVDRVVVIEKDDDLAAELETRWSSRPELEVVHGDALEVDLTQDLPAGAPFSIISNIPYSITSPLIFRFLDLEPPPRRIVATVQREVAERIVAAPGSKAYGALSVGVQVRAEARIAFRIGRRAFRPVPAVDSAAIVMDRRIDALSPGAFTHVRRLTRALFGQRRKQLQKILRSAPELGLSAESVESLLEQTGLDGRMRPEQLSPRQFVRLAASVAGSAERQR